jgi:hypothetical protein
MTLPTVLGPAVWAALVAREEDGRGLVGAGVLVDPAVAAAARRSLLREVAAVDTMTSGWIRVLAPADRAAVADDLPPPALLVEEHEIEGGRPVWRAVASASVADALVADRKEAYALMWGSCCAGQIDYLARFPASVPLPTPTSR